MVTLRKMQANEFGAFKEYFIEDYATEIAENYGHSKEHALVLAQNSLTASLPDGVNTKDHHLLCIELDCLDKKQVIGYLWHSIDQKEATSFIHDFYIVSEQRNKGYGKLAIAMLEYSLLELSIKQLKLRVAYYNKRALDLYKETGFIVTGYNMSKNLS